MLWSRDENIRAPPMTRIASFPMYDFPEVRHATDALWQALAARLRAAGLDTVPEMLDRRLTPHESWRHPHLLLGQSCGYPATTAFRPHLRIIATPLYAAPGCDGPMHCSFFIVPAASAATQLDDLRGRVFAFNSRDSNTGMNLPRYAIAPLAGGKNFFSRVIESGSHAESLARVAAGEADAAAIDCVTHALLARCRPHLVGATRILARTASSPALPFVTAQATDEAVVGALRAALDEVMRDRALATTRDTLFLSGVAPAGLDNYAVVLDYEAEARRLGYEALA
jgi:ABC-type phosphate/phosphonate transport system substrate-binding protein